MRIPPRPTLGLLPLLALGCHGGGGPITARPDNWADLLGRTVTVEGTAGNSSQGAIVRLADGSYVPLFSREKWGIDAVARPIRVTGEIVAGEGVRSEGYALKVSSITVTPADRQSGSSGGL